MEILRNAAASDAGEDDYSVEPILIEAGETAGTTTLMVTADDLPDGGTGTNQGETLMLFGTVGGMEIGDLTFTIWDTAGATGGRGGPARRAAAVARPCGHAGETTGHA